MTNKNNLKSSFLRGIVALLCVSAFFPCSAFGAIDGFPNPYIDSDDSGAYMALWRVKSQLLTSYSPDTGASWTPPTVRENDYVLTSPASSYAVVHAGSGIWLAVWEKVNPADTKQHITYSSRSTNGTIWSDPVVIYIGAPSKLLVSDGKGIVLLKTPDALLRSTDSGQSWSPIDISTIPEFQILALTSAGSGKWLGIASVGDNKLNPRVTRTYVSQDNGSTWSGPQTLNNSLEVVARAANGNTMALAAIPSVPGRPGSPIHIISSTNGGAAWSDPVPTTPNSLDYSFDFYMSVTDNGHWILAYKKHQENNPLPYPPTDIRVITSTNPASFWTPSQIVAPAKSVQTDYPTYKLEVDNTLFRVAMDNAGGAVMLYQAQENTTDATSYTSEYFLRSVRSTDFGATWSQPAPFNSEPPRADAKDWMLFH